MPTKKIVTKTTQKDVKTKASLKQSTTDLSAMITPNSQLEIKLTWKKMGPIYQQKLKQTAQNLKIKGFRKGMVPLHIAEKNIDQEKIINLVLKDVLPAAYDQAIAQGNYKPLTFPEFQAISLNKDNDWIIKAQFAQQPSIELKNYRRIAQKAKKEAIAQLKQIKTTAKQKKVKSAHNNKKSEANQSVKELTGQQKDDAILQKIIATLIEKIKPTIPELLVKQQVQQEMENLTQQLKKLNITLETFLEARKMTQDQLGYQLTSSALSQLQVEFLIQTIARQEQLDITEQEIKDVIDKNEDQKIKEQMKKSKNYQQQLKQMLFKQKVIKFLLDL
jgi:FKBP-type peptidyl-prolyl cis-trans isomerase (trigger factor)